MEIIKTYGKAIGGATLAGLGTTATALADSHVTALEGVFIATSIVATLLGVNYAPYRPVARRR